MKRREFLGRTGKSLLALGVLGLGARPPRILGESRAEEIYRKNLSIDAMCFTTEDYVPYLDDARVEALRDSGISLISLDVSIGGGPGMGAREWPVVIHQIAQWSDFFRKHPDVFLRVFSSTDVLEAKRIGRVGIVYNLQDTTPIAQNLHRVGMFYEMGIRQIQLSHNQRNFVVDSCWEPTNAGLSRFGRRLIAELNRSRILIDVAHVGESSTLETVLRSSAPVLASHTGCLALCPHPRNKSDRVMKAIADRGGVVCIYNMSGWMSRQPEPDMDIYLRHLKHALGAAGEDHVGFGTDGDPAAMSPEQRAWEIDYSQKSFDEQVKDFPRLDWPIRHIRIPELDSPGRLLNLTRAMEREGYPARIIEKVIGGNYFRLFQEVVG